MPLRAGSTPACEDSAVHWTRSTAGLNAYFEGGFTIGWIELESERHGVIDYWENGVNNEYPISIVWNGNSWEEAAST